MSQPFSRESLASRLTDALISTLTWDVAIEERMSALRKKQQHERHAKALSEQARSQSTSANGSASGTPTQNGVHLTNGNGSAASSSKRDEAFYACLICGRSVVSSRYSSHLSGCMGLGRNGQRSRAAAINGQNKLKNRSGSRSPYQSDDDARASTSSNAFERKNAFSFHKSGRPGAFSKRIGGNSPMSRPLKKARSDTPPGSHPLAKSMSASAATPPQAISDVIALDRADSESSSDEDESDFDKPPSMKAHIQRPPPPQAPPGKNKPKQTLPRVAPRTGTHPLAKGVDSDSSKSDEDAVGSEDSEDSD